MKQKVCKFDELVSGKARRFEIGSRAIQLCALTTRFMQSATSAVTLMLRYLTAKCCVTPKKSSAFVTPVRSALKLANQTPCLQRSQCPYMSRRLITAKYSSS